MFGCNSYKLPFRVLSKREVLCLSGLEDHWTNTDLDDAERFPDASSEILVATLSILH